MKNIIINAGRDETQAALLDNGKLIELLVDKKDSTSLVGNIYAAKIIKILPSQFAFVDIGNKRNAFIHLADSKEKSLYEGEEPKLSLRVKQNDEILVQIIKDPSGNKGFNATTQLSFAGQYVVIIMDNGGEVGVSQKIEEESERLRLKDLITPLIPEGFSAILRTKARDITSEELSAETNKLVEIALEVCEKGKNTMAPAEIYKETAALNKGVREFLSADIGNIYINDEDTAEDIRNFFNLQNIGFADKIVLYNSPEPIFEHFFIKDQIRKAFNEKVWLKSGGFIIIEQTEAAVVIDVNTGKYTGKKNHEHTVLKTNMEAATEIAYQLRLRNLSGMVIIDYIDLKTTEDIKLLSDHFKKELRKDRINVNIVGATQLGLFLLTRKKTREPLEHFVSRPCRHCGGRGRLFSE